MFNFKDTKNQKKLIYSLLSLIIITGSLYSAWFLYNNFYQTIDWRDDPSFNLHTTGAIQNVNLNKMKQVVEKLETEASPSRQEIKIYFR